jgi:solute:Na+ symporter, SSS family
VVLCAGILGAQALAIGTVVNATLDVPTVPAVIIGMGVVVLYSSFGGAWAVIQTDLLQFVFLGVLLPVALLIGLDAVGGP